MGKEMLRVEHVGMKFNLSRERVDTLKEYVLKKIKGEIKYNEFWALKDVDFSVEKGDRVGILGLNGAGKSTLLKVVAGVFKPTEGQVIKRGKIVPLLELAQALKSSIPERKISICMERCLDTPKALSRKSTTRSWNFRN